MIFETIITTLNPDATPHIAPMGVQREGDLLVLAPFRPSSTLENLQRSREAVMNLTDDVRVFAGCVSGRRRNWPVRPARSVNGCVLEGALSHVELKVERMDEDAVRPRFFCRAVESATHAPFRGFNRAQAAVIEAAVLTSRLDRLPASKIDAEIEYLRIAIDKTAGERERMAWDWLMQRVAEHRAAAGVHS